MAVKSDRPAVDPSLSASTTREDTMRKRITWLLSAALLLALTGCHFHGRGHPHGVPPGQAKKALTHGKVKAHPAKPWK